MAQSQYLTEKNYNRINKKIKSISLVVLIIAILAGGTLITLGAIKSSEAKRINEERGAAALAESEAKVAAAKERLNEIETEKATLESEYNAKQQQCDSLDMGASNWFANKTQCERESSSIRSKISDLEMEQFKLENANYDVYYDLEHPEKFVLFYIVGAICIGVGLLASLSMFLITKRRALRAYGIQSTMPVNKEAVKKYTPTAAKAAGNIAGAVAEGISRGVKKGKRS